VHFAPPCYGTAEPVAECKNPVVLNIFPSPHAVGKVANCVSRMGLQVCILQPPEAMAQPLLTVCRISLTFGQDGNPSFALLPPANHPALRLASWGVRESVSHPADSPLYTRGPMACANFRRLAANWPAALSGPIVQPRPQGATTGWTNTRRRRIAALRQAGQLFNCALRRNHRANCLTVPEGHYHRPHQYLTRSPLGG